MADILGYWQNINLIKSYYTAYNIFSIQKNFS